MAIDILQSLDIIEVMENFISKRRPPEHIRKKVDLAYKIEEQSIIIFEIRQRLLNPEKTIECNVAKATYVHTQKCWKVFWQRSDLKWHSYSPKPTVKTLDEFVKLVDEDKHYCFWG